MSAYSTKTKIKHPLFQSIFSKIRTFREERCLNFTSLDDNESWAEEMISISLYREEIFAIAKILAIMNYREDRKGINFFDRSGCIPGPEDCKLYSPEYMLIERQIETKLKNLDNLCDYMGADSLYIVPTAKEFMDAFSCKKLL